MATVFRPRTVVLFAGDLFFLTLSLWISLVLRGFELPSSETFMDHLVPFAYLFALWVGVFFIAGLYESRSIILARRALSTTLLAAQTFNIVIAALFFFFIPLFGLAPKTILFIYLLVSFVAILLWRAYLFPYLGLQKPEHAIVIGGKPEIVELVAALARAPFAPARVVETLSPESSTLTEDIQAALARHRARFVIADFSDMRVARAFPEIYNFLSSGIRFFDALSLYEEVFGRVPLSKLDDRWLAQNIALSPRVMYDILKRIMDISVGFVGGVVSLAFYPFIMLAITLNDGGPIFYHTERVGQHGRVFIMHKFRSMNGADKGAEALNSKLTVTRVGRFLRKMHIDELPQFWNVLRGDLSLIGPRPELPALVSEYETQIPYYGVRHLAKPGLSGWARLYHAADPHHGTEVEATREKLSYDLYYLKHRSITLDAIIILKTIKKLLTRSGV